METIDERKARLGAVKSTTSGKQVEGKGKYRLSRYAHVKPFKWQCDDATSVMHYEADVDGHHVDIYIEKEEMLQALSLMGWL